MQNHFFLGTYESFYAENDNMFSCFLNSVKINHMNWLGPPFSIEFVTVKRLGTIVKLDLIQVTDYSLSL